MCMAVQAQGGVGKNSEEEEDDFDETALRGGGFASGSCAQHVQHSARLLLISLSIPSSESAGQQQQRQ